jgi:hypothetical protein
MATINASISVTSNIMSYPTTISKTMTMTKADSCTGLEETSGLNSRKFKSVSAVVIISNTEGTADKASKVYIRNTGSDKTKYFYVSLNASGSVAATTESIGKLYAGDWMLIPWVATAATTHDFCVVPSSAETMTLEWMVFEE